MKKTVVIFIVIFLFSACVAKRPVTDVSNVPPPKRISKKSGGFWAEFAKQMRFKNITPDMEIQLQDLMTQGCIPEYEILENKTAYMYSLIPGGGQIYTGEPKKALFYVLGSILIVPYFISFEDAQNSVDYLNAQYSIDYCRKKLRLSRHMEKRAKNREFMDQIIREQYQNKMDNP